VHERNVADIDKGPEPIFGRRSAGRARGEDAGHILSKW